MNPTVQPIPIATQGVPQNVPAPSSPKSMVFGTDVCLLVLLCALSLRHVLGIKLDGLFGGGAYVDPPKPATAK